MILTETLLWFQFLAWWCFWVHFSIFVYLRRRWAHVHTAGMAGLYIILQKHHYQHVYCHYPIFPSMLQSRGEIRRSRRVISPNSGRKSTEMEARKHKSPSNEKILRLFSLYHSRVSRLT